MHRMKKQDYSLFEYEALVPYEREALMSLYHQDNEKEALKRQQ